MLCEINLAVNGMSCAADAEFMFETVPPTGDFSYPPGYPPGGGESSLNAEVHDHLRTLAMRAPAPTDPEPRPRGEVRLGLCWEHVGPALDNWDLADEWRVRRAK